MTDWVTALMEHGGYLTIAGLMLLENVFPPIPSELIMPLAGYAAERGDLNIFLVILAGSAGSVAGAFFWYAIGLWVGSDGLRRFAARHGRWLTMSPREVDRAVRWFDRFGNRVVFFGRLVPAVRTLISVPAGISDISLRRFLIYTTAGTVLWTALLAMTGWALGSRYAAVGGWLDPVSTVVIGLLVAWYLWRVATFRRGKD